MADKKSHLDVQTYTIDGQNYLGITTTADFDATVLTDDCRVIGDRHHTEIPTKKRLEWTSEQIPHVSNLCQTNLTLSVFTVGGESFLGEIDNFEFSVDTDTVSTSGAAELWEWPQATGTVHGITAEKFIAGNADIFQRTLENNITAVQVDVVFTVAGTSINVPMTMSAATHRTNVGEVQMENVTFSPRGTPSAATGDALIVSILIGDAYVSWVVDTDAGQYSGNAIITSARMSVNNAQLVRTSFGFANQGQPAFVAA